MMKVVYSLLFLFIAGSSFGQFTVAQYEKKIDSLEALKPTKDNLNALNEIAFKGKYIDYKLTDRAANYVLKHSEKLDFESTHAFANKVKGIIADETGRYQDAIGHYLAAIKKYKTVGSQLDIAKCEGNIGMIFRRQLKHDQALVYFKNSLETFEKENFGYGVLNVKNNLGIIYLELGQPDSSLYYLKEAEDIMLKLGVFDPNLYGNKGNTYSQLGQIDLAEENYRKCIDYYDQAGAINQNLAIWYFSYGNILAKQGKYEEALDYLSKSKEIIGDNIYTREAKTLYDLIGSLNFDQGNFRESAIGYRRLSRIKDTLYAIDNSKLTSELSEKYQTEKKELKIESLNKEKKIEEEKRKNEEQKVLYLTLGALLLGVILIYSFISIKTKISDNKKIKAKNELIQLQKDLVEEKSKEILDSIQYAKRLQNAILPNIKLVKEHFADSFILFKPKDIVSGDFYWMETKGNLVMFAAADCTGHGVPGAMVSVVCANALNKSVNELSLMDPAEILNQTREFVVDTFSKTGSEEVKDGMDISLCVYNVDTNELKWSGANNPLWIIRQGTNEIEAIAPNKQPIGAFENQSGFTSHSTKMSQGDAIYIFSDGYADQFGGERGKKLMSKNFKTIILGMQDQNMLEQKSSLDTVFEDWKGELDQLDDVCVIGVRF